MYVTCFFSLNFGFEPTKTKDDSVVFKTILNVRNHRQIEFVDAENPFNKSTK